MNRIALGNLNDPQSGRSISRRPRGVCSNLTLSPLARRPTTPITVNSSGSGGFQSGPSKLASAINPSETPVSHADRFGSFLLSSAHPVSMSESAIICSYPSRSSLVFGQRRRNLGARRVRRVRHSEKLADAPEVARKRPLRRDFGKRGRMTPGHRLPRL